MDPTLPKFLYCEPDPDELEEVCGYVLHTQDPPFLAQFIEHDNGAREGRLVRWFTDQSAFITQQLEAGVEPASTMARLMREAGDFMRECL